MSFLMLISKYIFYIYSMPPVATNILEMDSSLHAGWNYAHPEPGDEIMITGLSGCYPESDNVAHFAENLFNKVRYKHVLDFNSILD